MRTYVISYKTGKGQLASARVMAFDEKGARARFHHENPGLSITGVRKV